MFAFGDTQGLNDALYENYLDMFRYYDDDFEQAACMADCLSLDQHNENYVMRTQDYSLRSFAYLPSVSFKMRSKRIHDFRKKMEYPKIHRQMNMERRKAADVLDSLVDLKTKKTSTFKQLKATKTAAGDADQERDSSG